MLVVEGSKLIGVRPTGTATLPDEVKKLTPKEFSEKYGND